MYQQLVHGLLIGFSGVWFASAALALEPCNEVVVDEANILSTSDENSIATAAAELTALGVTVRVRTSLDQGRFSSLQMAADTVCADSWGSDRMVYWVTTATSGVGIYTGLAWEGKITPSIQSQIIDVEMMPALRTNSFAAAFIQAILKTEEHLRGVPTVTPQVVVTPVTPERAPIVIREKPAANQWSFATVAAILAALLAVVGAWFGWRFFMGERSRKDTVARTQQSAVVISNQCMELITSFNGFDERLKQQLVSQADVLAKAVLQAFTKRLETLLIDAEEANREFNGHNNPSTEGKELGWYEALHASVTASKQKLQTLADAFQALEAEITEAVGVAAAMPEHLLAATIEMTVNQSRLTAVATAGFKVTALQSELDAQKVVLTAVNTKAEQKAYAEAGDLIAKVTKESSIIIRTAEALPAQKNHLMERLATLTSTFALMPPLVTTAEKTFTDIEAAFVESSYASIAGNGTEAEARLDEAEALLNKVPVQLHEQQFDEGDKTLDRVDMLLDETSSLLEAIMALEKRLIFAKSEVGTVLVEAKRSIAAALSYLSQYDADTNDKLLEPLTEAQKICEKVERTLNQNKPDYIEMLALGTKADSMADEVLADAQGEYEQSERNRRQAATLRAQALHDADDMQSYIKNHRSDIRMGHSTQNEYNRMATELETLHRLGDTLAIINLARSISERSATLKRDARRDFEAAEAGRASATAAAERRDRERRSENSSRDSIGVTKQWGSAPASGSVGTTSSWRKSAESSRSIGTTRSFIAPSVRSSSSIGTTKKW